MRIFIAILLLAASGFVEAANPHGYTITVSPSPVPPGSTIGITIDTTQEQCLPLPDTLKPSAPKNGIVYLWIPSSDGCEMVPPESRSYILPPMPSGQYIFNFYSCGGIDAETGEEACNTIEDVPVTVLGLSATSHTIPTLSGVAMLGLALLMMALGTRLRWR